MIDNSVEILLVEDNPADVELTLDALRVNNLANNIHVVRDGFEAIEFLFCTGQYANRPRHNPKLVLLDLKLPKLNGIEVLRRIRENSDTRTLPVVILTTSREERDMTQTYDLNVNSYIVKPVDFEQFTESVKQIGFYWLLLNQPPE
jgi:two-component system response regulator